MKTVLTICVGLLAGHSAFAQGTVNFVNRITGSLDAPVFDTDGVTKIPGTNFLAQLYAGLDQSSLIPIGVAVPFRIGTGAGYWNPAPDATRVTPVPAGQIAFLQVRVWEVAAGTNYEQAVATGGKHGFSNTFGVVTGGFGSPPSLPADLIGLRSFSLVQGAKTVETQTITVPSGFSLISNPFFKGSNTVVEIMPNVPEGTVLFRFDNGTKIYSVNIFDFGRWSHPEQQLVPGEGAFILNPQGASFDITFTGTAGPGNLITNRVPGFYLVGCAGTNSCRIEQFLSFSPVQGDTVYRFSAGKYLLSAFDFGDWQGFLPIIDAGTSVFLRLVSSAGQ